MRSRSAHRHSRGAAAVELAMTAPLLIALAGGLVEWGWFMDQEVAVIQAVRDGARAGALVDTHVDDPATVAQARVLVSLDAAGLEATSDDVVVTQETTDVGEALVVTADVAYPPLLGIIPMPGRLAANITMRLELQP